MTPPFKPQVGEFPGKWNISEQFEYLVALIISHSQVVSETDTRYFDSEFTGEISHLTCFIIFTFYVSLPASLPSYPLLPGESVELTPPDHQSSHLIQSIAEDAEEEDQDYFNQVNCLQYSPHPYHILREGSKN